MTFTELAAVSGLAKSTTSRMLLALERNGLIRREPTRSVQAWGCLCAIRPALQLRSRSRWHRPSLLERLGEHSVRDDQSRCGSPVDGGADSTGRQPLRTWGTNWLGRSEPLHCTALGKVLLAAGTAKLPPGRLARLTPKTITRRSVLEIELAEARRRGWALTDEELEPGLVAVAAPVYRSGGAAIAAISVSGPSTRLHRALDDRGCRAVHGGGQRPLRRAWLQTTERRCCVNKQELLKQMYDFTLVGNAPEVLELTNAGLEMGLNPETMLFEALIPSLEEVGARFERGDFFVPEMLIAGKAMAGALEVLRPLLAETGVEPVGTFVMGTVKGDVHDIGKNLVNIMLEGAGFHVIDLGVQVAPEKFVEAIREHHPDIVGFSAFLTTTMPMFKANMNALEKAGLRDQVIVMVGGAPVTQEYADAVGADGYAVQTPPPR